MAINIYSRLSRVEFTTFIVTRVNFLNSIKFSINIKNLDYVLSLSHFMPYD